MNKESPLDKGFERQIYKERCFDFCNVAFYFLVKRSNTLEIKRKDCYRIFAQVFHLRKELSKLLLVDLENEGYIENRKHHIRLLISGGES
jgi:hypothetical protein